MGKTLYEEALADARQLKEAAEHNAKAAVMEAITPKIRRLIDRQLLEDDERGDVEQDEDDVLLDLMSAGDELAAGEPNDQGKISVDMDALSPGGADVHAQGAGMSDDELGVLSDDEPMQLDDGALNALGSMASFREGMDRDELTEAIDDLADAVNECTHGDKTRVETLRKQVETAYTALQESSVKNRSLLESRLENLYSTLNLMKEPGEHAMSLNEETLTITIDGLPDGVSATADIGGADDDEEDMDMDMDMDMDAGDEEGLPPSGDEEGDELDLEGVYEMLNMSEGDDVSENEDEMLEIEGLDLSHLSDDTVIEISETELRHELARMKALREADLDESVDGSEFGGGHYEELPTEAGLNKHDGVGTKGPGAGQKGGMREALNTMNALRRQNRALKNEIKKHVSSLTEAKSTLKSLNLFNHKLLFTNKLLQSEGLSAKQKLVIAERLDEAKSLREVKLIYNSLTEALTQKKGLNESRTAKRVLGSSSRFTKSGQPASDLNESAELSRWNKLAGLDTK